MKHRILGAILFGAFGAIVGTGLSAQTGTFGPVAGAALLGGIGAAHGLGAGPDLARRIACRRGGRF